MSDGSRFRKSSFAPLVALLLTLGSARAAAQIPPFPPGSDAGAPPPAAAPTTQTPTEPPAGSAAPTPSAPSAVPMPEEPVRYPVMGKAREIRVTEDMAIRLGLQAQVWADSSQDSNKEADGSDGGYQNNMFVRRGRIITGMHIRDRITAYVLLEGANLGRATGDPNNPKNYNSIALYDAWGEVKFHDAFMLNGGLMLVPVSRNVVQATTTYLTLDTGNTTAVTLPAMQTSLLRDVGFQAKGMLFGDHFEYRLGVFSGIRQPPSTMPPQVGAQNAPRFSGYFQYNFLEPEKGYVFHGTYYGRKKVLGISSGVDFQKGSNVDPYYAVSGSAFAAIPLNGDAKAGGDEIGGLFQYIYYDGQETAPTIAGQNDFLVEAAYYNKASRLSVFGKFEAQLFGRDATKPNDRLWFGGGLKFHLFENYCNFTLAYNRVHFPEAPTTGPGAKNSTNQFTFAMQIFYF